MLNGAGHILKSEYYSKKIEKINDILAKEERTAKYDGKKINPNNIIVVLMRNKHDLKHTTRADPHVWSENAGVSAEQ